MMCANVVMGFFSALDRPCYYWLLALLLEHGATLCEQRETESRIVEAWKLPSGEVLFVSLDALRRTIILEKMEAC